MIDVDPTHYYNPDVPGVLLPAEDRWIKFGKHYFCPIVLDQVVHSRYRILSLLGWGSYAMVWLAVDQCPSSPSMPSPKYVALKIFRGANHSPDEYSNNEELCLQRLLQGRARGGSGRRNIIEMFDAFDIESANGVHRCLVLELGGLDFASLAILEDYEFDDAVYLFKQCVETVEYLHSLEICHGDLDLSNFVIALPDFSGFAEADVIAMLVPDPRSSIRPVGMKDGSPLPAGVPETICSPCPFDNSKLDLEDWQVRLIDFGESFTGSKPGVRTHGPNTPPELVQQGVASSSSDIWALGCIFWHLLIGHPLMSNFSEWPQKDRYEGLGIFLSISREQRRAKMATFLAGTFQAGADDECIAAILDVLLDTLEPNPSDRPSASELLSYSLFSLIEEDRDEPNDNASGVSDREIVPAPRTGPFTSRSDDQATDSESVAELPSLRDHKTPNDNLVFLPTPPSSSSLS